MKKVILILTILMLGVTGIVHSETSFEAEAVKAADEWLNLLDQKEYAQCWTNSAKYFREQVSQEQWLEGMNSIGNLVGSVENRTMRSANYFRALPNAPMGEYVVIVYDITLKSGQTAVETVTPMKDPDNLWRVSGYYIKPSN